MELYKNVYQIQSLYGGRNLFQYLFRGDNIVLADTGIAETPEKTIFPYMVRLKIRPEQLTLAVTTHADLDHRGAKTPLSGFGRSRCCCWGGAIAALSRIRGRSLNFGTTSLSRTPV